MTDKLDPLRGRMHTLEGRLNVLSKGKFNNGAYSRGLETCTVGDVLRAMDSIPVSV